MADLDVLERGVAQPPPAPAVARRRSSDRAWITRCLLRLASFLRHERFDPVRVHGFGRLPSPPEQHRAVRVVAVAGEAQGAEQLASHPRHAWQLATAAQPLGEAQRRAHRPHRVAARWADPDVEELEDAQHTEGGMIRPRGRHR